MVPGVLEKSKVFAFLLVLLPHYMPPQIFIFHSCSGVENSALFILIHIGEEYPKMAVCVALFL